MRSQASVLFPQQRILHATPRKKVASASLGTNIETVNYYYYEKSIVCLCQFVSGGFAQKKLIVFASKDIAIVLFMSDIAGANHTQIFLIS